MTTLDKDALVALYIRERDAIAEIKARMDEEAAPHKATMEKVELYFKGCASVEKVDSWKTQHGTVYLSRIESVRLADPSAFFEFVIGTESWDLLEKRASKSGVTGYLEAHNTLPPGAEISTRVDVNFRRPSAA